MTYVLLCSGARGESLTGCSVIGRGRLLSGIRLMGSTGIRSVVNSMVTGTTSTGIELSGSANQVIVRSTVVLNNRTSGSTGITVSMRQVSLHFTDCHVEGYSTGLSANINGSSNISITNSTVRRNSYRGAYVYWSHGYYQRYIQSPSQRNRRLEISHCVFTDTPSNNALYAYVYNPYSYVTVQVDITDNVFERNLQALFFRRYYRGISAIIARNTFSHNDGGCCSGALDIQDNLYYSSSTHQPVTVEQNVFTWNRGEYVASLRTRASFQSSYQLDSVVLFRNNNMTNNTLSSLPSRSVKSTPNAVLVITGTLFTTVYHNIFDNLNATTELAVQVEGYSSLDKINVTLNWWGTADESKIFDRIFDFDDRNHLAVASYFPFLLSPSISDVASSSHPRSYPPFLTNANEFGGQLAGDFTLLAFGGPYTVTRDITVLPNATLTVEAGTVLKFLPCVGVLIEGSLVTKGTLSHPVIFTQAVQPTPPQSERSIVVRLEEIYNYGSWVYGYVQIHLSGTWQPVCFGAAQNDYVLLQRSAGMICGQLGFHDSFWSTDDWFPSLGDAVIHNFWCPGNATSFHDCFYNTSSYAAHTGCLQVLIVGCYTWMSRPRTIDGKWAGVRFAPTSSVALSGPNHRTPTSVLTYTEIIGAGRRIHTTVPSVQAIFRPPKTVGLTIRDSASTAMEVSYLHEQSVISGVTVIGGTGDGIAIRRPRGHSVIVESVTVSNVTGAGIHVYSSTSSLNVNSDYQSICSGQSTISVDAVEGSYVGKSQDDHLPGITCSVVLQGPPNTVLSVRIVNLRLYSDDNLHIHDGIQPNSSLLGSYAGYISNYLQAPLLSSSNNVYVEVRTGQETGAPGFGLYVDAVPVDRDQPVVTITNSSVHNSQYGVYLENAEDDARIENVTVFDALSHGIYVYSHVGDVMIAKCLVVNAGSIGVYDGYGEGHATIRDNEIVNSSQGIDVRKYLGYNRVVNCDVTVSGNIISGTKSRAANLYLYSYSYYYYNYFYYYYYYNYDALCLCDVSRNILMSNQDGLLLQLDKVNINNGHRTFVNISNNVFLNNSGTDLSLSQGGIWDVTVISNTFEGHRAGGGGCLLLQGYAISLLVTGNNFTGNRGKDVVRLAPEKITDTPFVFSDNELTDNYVDDSVSYRRDRLSAVLVVAKSDQFLIRNNRFNNVGSLFEVGVEIPVQSSQERVIDMTKNYWGTTDENAIIDRIHDFGYCSRLASVQYFPYLTSPSGNAVSSSVSRTTEIIRPNGIVRGRVATDTILLATGSPYVVTGDITVLPGRTLTIEAGVELRFTLNTGILVEGQLIAHGTDTSPITLTDNSLVVTQRNEGGLRIVDGPSPWRGRVEVFHNGSWGPVCVVQDQTSWWWWRTYHDYYNTQVICRDLGSSGAYWQGSYVDPLIRNSNENAWLGHVLCRGTEQSLRQCTNYILETATCRYGQLVASCFPGVNEKQWTHWTGVRFAAGATGFSSLQHVVVNSTGMANGGLIPAVQSIAANVEFHDVIVTNSAWTGFEISHCDFCNVSHVTSHENDGSGVQLIRTAASSITGLISKKNGGHGLAITVDSVLQRMWNIPVLYGKIVDICAHSGTLSASTPFFLRFTASPTSRYSDSSRYCTATIQSTPSHVLSVHIMAIAFQNWNSYVNIDSTSVFRRQRLQRAVPLHYTSQTGSMTVVVVPTYSALRFKLEDNYFLAYVEQHPTGQWQTICCELCK